MGVKGAWDTYQNWGSYKKAAIVGLVVITLVMVWSSDYGKTTPQ